MPAPVSEENPTSEVKVITQTIDGLLLDRPYLIRYPENPSEENYSVVFFFVGPDILEIILSKGRR